MLPGSLNSLVWRVNPRFFFPWPPQYFLSPGILVHFEQITATPDGYHESKDQQ